MPSPLFGIALSALLSSTSLLVVLFRVSPISSPLYALPSFFISLLLSMSSVGALIAFTVWKFVTIHTWDFGQMIAISIRQGILFGIAACLIALLFVLNMFTWWLALIVLAMVTVTEVALHV